MMAISNRKETGELFFVDDPLFHDASSREEILETVWDESSGTTTESSLLTASQERSLFLRMNCLKWMASRERNRTDNKRDVKRVRVLLDSAIDVRNRIVSANLGLVRSVANRLSKDGETREELYGEGSLALIRIVEHFNVGFGFKFSTYAMRALMRELGRSMTRRISAPHYNAATEAIEEIPMPINGDHFDSEQQELALEILRELPDRERELLKVRYGFYGNERKLSFRKLSKRFGISAERLRQLERKSCQFARTHYGEKLGLAN
ncbi:MAG: sigma-70 family RNA polymerase sigma factor [Pirellulaceae bacterium]